VLKTSNRRLSFLQFFDYSHFFSSRLCELVMDDLRDSGKLKDLERRCEELLQSTSLQDFESDSGQIITELSRMIESMKPSDQVMRPIRRVVTQVSRESDEDGDF
jgi:hypothetical protein